MTKKKPEASIKQQAFTKRLNERIIALTLSKVKIAELIKHSRPRLYRRLEDCKFTDAEMKLIRQKYF